jgi:hypothetical protein
MKTYLTAVALSLFLILPLAQQASAQTTDSMLFRLSEGFVRIAEPGQIADTLSVWGDVNAPGRYIIPRGTTVGELISYARGPSKQSGGQRADWNEIRLEISISRFNENTGQEQIFNYKHRYDGAYPAELRTFRLESDDIVSLEVISKPAFVDWISVFSGIISATATTIIVVDRLTQ